jgi:hypothetical protein
MKWYLENNNLLAHQQSGFKQLGSTKDLSSTLFLLFINDLVADIPRGIKAADYADDLVLFAQRSRIQQAADQL